MVSKSKAGRKQIQSPPQKPPQRRVIPSRRPDHRINGAVPASERVWTPLTPSKPPPDVGINMWLEALSECLRSRFDIANASEWHCPSVPSMLRHAISTWQLYCGSTTGKYRLGHGSRDPAVARDALLDQFPGIDPDWDPVPRDQC